MDKNLLTVSLSIFAGAIGYLVTTFYIRPILQYHELRMKIFADFIFYAQVEIEDGLNDRLKALYEERIKSNRRNSGDLAALLNELPSWYKWWLYRQGQDPEEASRLLIGYSNATEYDGAAKRMKAIKKALGFKGNDNEEP